MHCRIESLAMIVTGEKSVDGRDGVVQVLPMDRWVVPGRAEQARSATPQASEMRLTMKDDPTRPLSSRNEMGDSDDDGDGDVSAGKARRWTQSAWSGRT